jgi:hypothetical protein
VPDQPSGHLATPPTDIADRRSWAAAAVDLV